MKNKMLSINPYNHETLASFDIDGQSEINNAIKESVNSYNHWKNVSLKERAGYMHKCGEVLRAKKEEYARLISLEMGKVMKESLAEIEKSALICDYYGQHGEEFLAPKPLDVPEGKSYLAYDPLGPILAIMPWNFPFYQLFRFAPPTLMAGNTIILKHSSNVPQCSLAIEKCFSEAGLPQGVFKSMLIDSRSAMKVLEDKNIMGVSLTGSVGAGSKVGEIAGKHVKKSVLELGGSDPFIVLEDADIQKASATAAKSRMINCGQSCIAAKRFIVHADCYNIFRDQFIQHLENMKFGNQLDEETDYASLASKNLREELNRQIEGSIAKGAEIYWKKNGINSEEAFYPPMVLENIKPGMPAYEEEIFGPVALFFKVNSENEAIEIANNTSFGLGASIWSTDTEKAEKIARKIESGIIYINDLVASKPEVPFGGVKKSGYGRELSFTGIREFVNEKTIWIK